MNKVEITKALAVANKVCGGSDLDKEVVRVYLNLLSQYTDEQITAALHICMRECKGHLAYRDIASRINDGWPNPQEAWQICPKHERQTVVWTDEISQAFGSIDSFDDMIAARMSFIEKYTGLLSQSRAEGHRPVWYPSLGSDPAQREAAIQAAVQAGRLPPDHPVTVGHELPPSQPQPRMAELVGEVLEGCSLDEDELDDETAAALARLRGGEACGVGEGGE